MQTLIKGKQATLISDKIDFGVKKITRKLHYIMLKMSVFQEDRAIPTVYAPKNILQNT